MESLVGLSIMSVVVIVLVPSLVQTFELIGQTQMEVEGWRYFQDSATIINAGGLPQLQTSDGNSLEWQTSGSRHQVIVTRPGKREVLYVEVLDQPAQ